MAMIRDTASMLAYEARRRPALAAVLSKIATVTVDDIDSLPYLKWVKQALREERQKQIATLRMRETQTALEDHIVDGVVPDIEGDIRRWAGGETFVKVDRGEWLLQPNALIFLPQTGGVWIKTAFAKTIDARLFTQTTEVGLRTKSQYTALYRAEEARDAPFEAPLIVAAPGTQSLLGHYGVQILR